ncbi:NCS1 family nucleobase:cation symporter-1 [Larsenimonas suaedae]|uniref:NCS1 family nucleobase:cation symporter-1 n=1 Tax=Larsenimonas suaedae TaxID=1851019 RepID=A0ABU1GRF1_9GAMM|nr:NCS1 family nucleobase:cation symporter-1 [Larsenimonas suaedae]MCM2972596.1 NCS1 family nucleobase:cation symporter-1 [Larsenimonas suaedae]MDR5894608.1 NCS1 family nucleobase:cation symporter-1 [Larsenimonas suaedae]
MNTNKTEGQMPAAPDPHLHNEDLAPAKQDWNAYNIFAFWMADIHSVGGYVLAASLFGLGLMGWQVLISLLVGILVVQVFANAVARPSQRTGVPFPVICRMAFGTKGANVPAVIRGLIAVVWYGIQTWLASNALLLVLLRWFPGLESWAGTSFLGLSALGWFCFALMWVLQALVFWRGMDTIRRFNDWAGPLVYAVMFALAGWIVWRAGPENISLSLSNETLSGGEALWQMVVAAVLVAGYFAGPTLNFGDFSRYCATEKSVRRGNFWGLPVNFLMFSIITVVVVSGTPQVFGEMLTDPIETVARIDSATAAVLGVFAFVAATIGINIVANFVAPAFDFSHVAPEKISWRMGGMIAAVGSIFLTPWNLFNNPELIHYTVGVLAALIGPLYGIILVDFYKVRRQKIDLNALFSSEAGSAYHYQGGVNPVALRSLLMGGLVSIPVSLAPLGDISSFAVFLGGGIAALAHGWQSGLWRRGTARKPVTSRP